MFFFSTIYILLHIKYEQVIDKSMPVFNKQFYSDTVPENIELHSPLSVAIQAESPLGRKLIYTIVKGNELEEFAVDFNTGEWLFFVHQLFLLKSFYPSFILKMFVFLFNNF